MNIRKSSICSGVLAVMALGFASCEKSNKEKDLMPTQPQTTGFYIINQGHEASHIPGSMTAVDLSALNTSETADAFLAANGALIGDTPMDALVYGSKMYITVYDSDLIWVVNPQTLKALCSIRATAAQQGHNPRHLTAHAGKVYASMFTGYVAEIDTTAMTIEREIKVGPNPEGLGVAGGKLYVANSDGMNWMGNYSGAYISVIDLASGTESKIQDLTKIFNPTQIATNGTDLYVLCMGDYSTIPSAAWKIEGNDAHMVCEATDIKVSGRTLYAINNTFDITQVPTFEKYDAGTGALIGAMLNQTSAPEARVDWPCAFAVDSNTGDIVVMSNTMGEVYPSYRDPGYANIYDNEGNFKGRVATGVGPVCATFITDK